MRRVPSPASRVGPDPGDRCACGATHRPPGMVIVLGESAIDELGTYVRTRRWSRPLIVMDANTEEAVGWRVVDELSHGNLRVATFCFPERRGLLADETGVSRLADAVTEAETDVLVAVGSGVITDITRYVASRAGREFVSVPTAASMDGYASSVAAMEFGGMKTTFSATAPVAIFADSATVAAAPPEMTRSGLGDLLGKATARVDWLTSHALYGEPFCPEVERRVFEPVLEAATHPDEVLGQSAEAVTRLLRGLIESGIAMAMVGSSRPASGCEHHFSHFWDLLASQGRRPHAPHGLQVGYATHFAMRLQQFALDGGVPELVAPRPATADDEEARPWFAGHRAQVDAVRDDKRRFLREHAAAWPRTAARWEAARTRTLDARRVFPTVGKALLAAGIPVQPGFLDLDARMLRTTFRWANRLRSRYTVLDFLEGQGRLDEAIEAVLPAAPGAR
ncbi:MAG: sn-glycerol-1-phosphate dehydrogenase [Acidimicrobiales bacterium]